jgi:Ca2+-binding RTX toxin-like protein
MEPTIAIKRGTSRRNTLNGTAGSDSIIGTSKADVINGGNNGDTINGGVFRVGRRPQTPAP